MEIKRASGKSSVFILDLRVIYNKQNKDSKMSD